MKKEKNESIANNEPISFLKKREEKNIALKN